MKSFQVTKNGISFEGSLSACLDRLGALNTRWNRAAIVRLKAFESHLIFGEDIEVCRVE